MSSFSSFHSLTLLPGSVVSDAADGCRWLEFWHIVSSSSDHHRCRPMHSSTFFPSNFFALSFDLSLSLATQVPASVVLIEQRRSGNYHLLTASSLLESLEKELIGQWREREGNREGN